MNNTAQRGGAVEVQNRQTNVLLQNSTFRSNTAEYTGSDVYATEIQQLRIANSRFISATSELEVSPVYCHVNSGHTHRTYSAPLRFWNTTFSGDNVTLVSNSNNFSIEATEENFIGKVDMQQVAVTLRLMETFYASGKKANMLSPFTDHVKGKLMFSVVLGCLSVYLSVCSIRWE